MLNVLPRYAPLNVPYRVNGYAVLRGNISSRSRIRANGSYVVRGEFGKTGFLATNLTPFKPLLFHAQNLGRAKIINNG